MDVGLATAFVGGTLALVSPCSALLLPAFFASTVGAGPRLLVHGLVFYVGLACVLIPIGVGAGAVATVFNQHREAVIVTASILLVAIGVWQALGRGFDLARMIPGFSRLSSHTTSQVGLVKTFLLGCTSGVAGFCAGPILGAIVTLAAARGDVFGAGTLLAVYGAGMVVPLLVIAALWQRLGDHGRRVLRGRGVRVAGLELHTTSLITGLLIIAVGIVFWTTNGLVDAPALVPASTEAWLQDKAGRLSSTAVDAALVVVAAAVVLAVWWRHTRHAASPHPNGDGE